jgi:hypothetical protein
MTQLTASPQTPDPSSAGPSSAGPGGTATPIAGTPRTPAERVVARWRRARADVRQTPGRMRLVSAGLVVAGLLAALGGAQAFRTAQGALERADANASQLVRLQLIQTSLVSADADATNAFLEGGLEPVEQRRDYDQALRRASAQIAYAARAQPADGTALAALNNDLQDYAGQVQLARANNRQGLPVGAQYLRAASATLRAGALPLLDNLTAANEQRARQEFSAARASLAWLMVTYPLVLAALVAALIWLARRTHRYLNVPLAGAGLVALVALIGGLIVLGSMAATVSDVRDGSYSSARALAGARVAAFDAKANESLTLVSRGSGASFETAWLEAAGEVTTGLAAGASAKEAELSWQQYADLHREIRELDEAGGWDQAVARATSRAADSPNRRFDTFDRATDTDLNAASAATTDQLRDAGRGLAVGGWLAALAGLAVAALAWWGLAQRIEEYR